jgi:outer membrane lipoprotein-sorting protein
MIHASRRAALAGLALFLAAPGLADAQAPRRPAIAPLSAEDKALVDKATAYLQGLTQIKGRFTQTDARGRVSQGDFYLKRPGKVRFAYDAPTDMLIVSNGSTVNMYAKRLGTFESYPLGVTPLSLFLAKEIRLDRGVQVSDVKRFADGFSLTAKDLKHETDGEIVLVFGSSPMVLREWTVLDGAGQKTRVALSGLQPAPSLDPALFVLRDPRPGPVGKR